MNLISSTSTDTYLRAYERAQEKSRVLKALCEEVLNTQDTTLCEDISRAHANLVTAVDRTRDAYYEARRDGMAEAGSPQGAHSGWSIRYGNFFTPGDNVLKPFATTPPSAKGLEYYARNLYAVTPDVSFSEVLREVEDMWGMVNPTERYREVFINRLRSNDRFNFLYLDLETTGLHPTHGEIIELGAVLTNPLSETLAEFSELYNLEDEDFAQKFGLGKQDVHGITYSDVKDKDPFVYSDGYFDLGQRLLEENTVLVAHNAGFEQMWLSHYVYGYFNYSDPVNYYMDAPVARVIDTKFVSSVFKPTPGNALQDFVEYSGGVYEDGHRALNDVFMMKNALDKVVNMAE